MIEINNLTTNSIDKEFLKKVVKIVLKGESVPLSGGWRKEEVELSIALVGQGRIRKLNKKYRRKNKVTDVLTFGQILNLRLTNRKLANSQPKIEKAGKFQNPNPIRGLGEIVICLREVKKNAKRIDLPFEKELARVLIHGVLHFLGYDHEKTKKEAEKMSEKEEYYLSQI